MKTNKLLSWLALGGGAFMLYRAYQMRRPLDVPIKGEIPPGSRPTGRVKKTTNSNWPDDPTERLAYMIREFVEVILPDGRLSWYEIDRQAIPEE